MKLFLMLPVLLLWTACGYSPEGPKAIAIAGARLEPGGGKPAIAFSIVVVEAGKFKAVGDQADVPMSKEYEIIDGLGQTIAPDGGVVETGKPANFTMTGPKGARTMREGQWQK